MKCDTTTKKRLESLCSDDMMVGSPYVGEVTHIQNSRVLKPFAWNQSSRRELLEDETVDGSKRSFTIELRKCAKDIDFLKDQSLKLRLPEIPLAATPPSIPLTATISGGDPELVYYYTSVSADSLTTGTTYLIRLGVPLTESAVTAAMENLTARFNLQSAPQFAFIFNPAHRVRWGQSVANAVFKSAEMTIDESYPSRLNREENYNFIQTKVSEPKRRAFLKGMASDVGWVNAPVGSASSASIPAQDVSVPLLFQNMGMGISSRNPNDEVDNVSFAISRYNCMRMVINLKSDIRKLLVLEESAAVDISANPIGFIGPAGPVTGSGPFTSTVLFGEMSDIGLASLSFNLSGAITEGEYYASTDSVVTGSITPSINGVNVPNPTGASFGLRYLGPSGGWRRITRPPRNRSFAGGESINYANWISIGGSGIPYPRFGLSIGGVTYTDTIYWRMLQDCSTRDYPQESVKTLSPKESAGYGDITTIDVNSRHDGYIKYILAYAVNDVARRQGNYFVYRATADVDVDELNLGIEPLSDSSIVGDIVVKIGDYEDTREDVRFIRYNVNPLFLGDPPEMNLFTAAAWTDHQLRHQGNVGYHINDSCDKVTVRMRMASGSADGLIFKPRLMVVYTCKDSDSVRMGMLRHM